MEIKGKVHCFFEQSGTFKNEFIKLGIPAEDYDIQDNFGQTEHKVDLFKAIDDAFEEKESLFDTIVGGKTLSLLSIPAFISAKVHSARSVSGISIIASLMTGRRYTGYLKGRNIEQTSIADLYALLECV